MHKNGDGLLRVGGRQVAVTIGSSRKTTGGQIAAFLLTNPILWGGIALIVRVVKSQDGSTKDYIEAMQKLRSEVVAIKVK